MNIIQMSGLYKRFGSKSIFHDFNLEIKKGEMVAITGSSGCGKTTLLNMIGLIEPIDSGEYFLLGKDTFNKLGYKAKINTHTTSYIN